GLQSLTRSMGARMIPKDRSGEFFGFFSVSIKFAGILGPLLFAFIAQIIGNSRGSILSIVVFFLVGLLLLTRVDVEEGMRAAEAKESVFRLTTTW
ncbi:MAG: MFS transporter, partial [Anaerolineales bacterium]